MDYSAFLKLSYGLYIIASEWESKRTGYIGNTVFQVTSQPPQVAISCHKDNFTTGVIRQSRLFSVSVLKKELAVSLIGEFGFMSGADIDKFARVKYQYFSKDLPVVTQDCVAWFECKVVNEVDCGSHILFIAEVTGSDVLSDEDPLTYDYYREKYKMLAPKNAPTYIDKEKITVEPPAIEEELPTTTIKEDSGMQVFTCSICGYSYDPEEGDPTMGIPPGTPFSELPDDYKCPVCNAGKEYFR
jgi:flavin reductase (DIM6/NTAB) family NADH-FMN oxidoreductase RutF/rubredoxin